MRLKKQLYQHIFNFALLLLCSTAGNAQAVKTYINRNQILIGEQIRFELKINLANSGYIIELNIPDSIPHFDIIDQSKYDTVDNQGVYTLRQNIVFTSFDSGVWRFPSFPIKISYADKVPQNFSSDSFLVSVGYSPADSTGQLRDIKPIMEVFVVDRKWMMIVAAVLGVLLLAFLIYRYFKKRKKKPAELFKSNLSAYDEAIKAIKELQATSVTDETSLKIYYTALSHIFKKYYSRKINKNLMSETTGDLLILLQKNTNNSETLSTAAEALRMSDAVKFAKYIPADKDNVQSVSFIKTTIDQLEKLSSF